MGGSRTAASILRPAVVDFLEVISPRGAVEVEVEEVVVAASSPLVGSRLDAIEDGLTSIRIVALRRGARPLQIAPAATTLVEPQDLLVVIGGRAALLELASRAEQPEA